MCAIISRIASVAGHMLRRRSGRWKRAYRLLTKLLTLLGLSGLCCLRLVGLYSHQELAIVLLLGRGWALVTRAWLARMGWLHRGLFRNCRDGTGRLYLLQAAGRATLCAAASLACLAAFPRSTEMTPLIVLLGGASLLRAVASFLAPHRTNAGPTLVNVPDIQWIAHHCWPEWTSRHRRFVRPDRV